MRADPPTTLLHATDISVRYAKQYALDALDLQLNAGDTLGLLGLNGAGKSTLLKVLAGACAPSRGRVVVDGIDMAENPTAARSFIGYAPDKPPLYPQFTVREFLLFAARLRKVPAAKSDSTINSVLERCGLTEVEKRVCGNLSHGYQQRINLAQALVHEPKVLILDEPANGLDPAQLLEMRSLINEVRRQQATIFSSHLLGEVQHVCNRVIVINRGHKMLDMPLSELSDNSHPTFEVILQKTARQIDLQDLPGVLRVCSVDSQHWLVTTDSENPSIERIGDALLARGLQLLEVNPVRNHLEKLFSQLKVNAGNPGINLNESPVGEPL